jgi:hypothetical protein
MNNMLSFNASSTDETKPLQFTLKINNNTIVNKPISIDELVTLELEDGESVIEFCLENKPAEYTKISEDGSIESDVMINIINIQYGGVDISQWIYDNATYHTATNQFTNIPNRFFGSMGCNGSVKFTLTAPALLWSLEHMI